MVLGCPHSGKTTYIASAYPQGSYDDIIDVYHYQHDEAYPGPAGDMPRHQMILLSNALFESDVVSAIEHARRDGSKTGRLILEGTFLRAARRSPWMQSIKNFKHPMTKVTCIWVSNPEREKMYESRDKEGVFELPSTEEGFDEVIVHVAEHDGRAGLDGAYGDTDEVGEEIKARVEAHNGRDRITAGDMLGYGALIRSASRSAEQGLLGFWRGDVRDDGEKR